MDANKRKVTDMKEKQPKFPRGQIGLRGDCECVKIQNKNINKKTKTEKKMKKKDRLWSRFSATSQRKIVNSPTIS